MLDDVRGGHQGLAEMGLDSHNLKVLIQEQQFPPPSLLKQILSVNLK
jgi:hypothetical protein